MTALLIVGYLVIGLLLAVPFALWAEHDGIESPHVFGVMAGLIWPASLFVFGLLTVFLIFGWLVQQGVNQVKRVTDR